MKALLPALWVISGLAFADARQSLDTPPAYGEVGPAHCGTNITILDVLAQRTPPDKLIIVVARPGDGDARPGLGRRRLHNVRTYWTQYLTHDSLRRRPETVVLAEGERVDGHGRLEFYVDGRVTAVLKVRRNGDLVVGTCYPDDEKDDICDYKTDRNFYPCIDKHSRRRKRR